MWLNCPASITKADGRTRPSSRYAREGTAAHTIAEMILGGDLFPPPKITVEGEQFIVGLPMLRALNPYISIIESIRNFTLAEDVHIEARVHLEAGKGHVWGTADCVALVGVDLYVVDLKYGMGVPVNPDSAQLKIYALAAADTFWPTMLIQDVYMTICQPRLDPVPKTCVMSAAELVRWRDKVLKPGIDRIVANDPTEKVGPYCRWCVRRNECEALTNRRAGEAADIFDDGVDVFNT
jgi:hypothetical protein